MKKILALTLVLVLALAGSAFAAVNFSGEFSATLQNGEDAGLLEGITITPGFKVNIGASAGDETNWTFEAESSLEESEFKLGKYKLALMDDYFDLYFWGNGKELEDKGTTLGLLNAGKAANTDRARVVVEALDPVTLTADFTQGLLYVFADTKVQGYDVGAALKKDGGTHTVGVWGEGKVDIVTLQADVAATLVEKEVEGEDDVDEDDTKTGVALGYGLKASADVTEQLNVYAQYLGQQDGFAGDITDKSKLTVGATYEESLLQVTAKVEQDLTKDPDVEDEEAEKADPKNVITLGTKYRFSEELGYGDLFKDDKYFTNNAPAVGASLQLDDFSINNVTLEAASPVVEDMVWVKGKVVYTPEEAKDDEVEGENGDDSPAIEHNFDVALDGYIKATNKLTVKPHVGYKTGESELDLKVGADYLIGSSEDVKLEVTVGRTTQFADTEVDPEAENVVTDTLKAGVTVKF